jgi:prophage regulatory protein
VTFALHVADYRLDARATPCNLYSASHRCRSQRVFVSLVINLQVDHSSYLFAGARQSYRAQAKTSLLLAGLCIVIAVSGGSSKAPPNDCRHSCSAALMVDLPRNQRRWQSPSSSSCCLLLEAKWRREIRGPERWLAMTSDTDERLLRLRDVKQKTGLGSSTIYRRIADGSFPAPRSLGPNTVRWLQSEIDAWIKSLPSSRSGEPVSASS